MLIEQVIGIDPGSSGAIANIRSEFPTSPNVWKLKDKTEADIAEYIRLFIVPSGPSFCFIEKLHAWPTSMQGSIANFGLGYSYGLLKGFLTAFEIPFEEVSPQKWQKALGCLTKGDKNVSKQKAQQLFPALKITHAIADATLIAEFGRRILLERELWHGLS